MTTHRTLVALVIAMLASSGLVAQHSTEERPQLFTFRPGQAVYVTAYHTDFRTTRLTPIPPANVVDTHLPAELHVRKDFDKRRVFRLVNRPADADFVFLVLLHDSAAEGLALAPEVFRQHATLDVEALRAAAYARSIVGPLKVHTLARLSDRLVHTFHDEHGNTPHK